VGRALSQVQHELAESKKQLQTLLDKLSSGAPIEGRHSETGTYVPRAIICWDCSTSANCKCHSQNLHLQKCLVCVSSADPQLQSNVAELRRAVEVWPLTSVLYSNRWNVAGQF
jgi:hypothetical protein